MREESAKAYVQKKLLDEVFRDEQEQLDKEFSWKFFEGLIGREGVLEWRLFAELLSEENKANPLSEVEVKELETARASFQRNLMRLMLLLHGQRILLRGMDLALHHMSSRMMRMHVQRWFVEMATNQVLMQFKGPKRKVKTYIKLLRETLGKDEADDKELQEKMLRESLTHSEVFERELMKNEMLQEWDLARLYSVVTSAWTAFECFCGDVWEAVLNARAQELIQPAFDNMPDAAEESGLSKKAIQVGELAKHGLNLVGKLGTILRQHFDFSSVRGLQQAFRCIFRRTENVEEIGFHEPVVSECENVRNVIVHRGGLADSKFLSRTKRSMKEGEPVIVTPAEIDTYVKGILLVARQLSFKLKDFLVNGAIRSNAAKPIS